MRVRIAGMLAAASIVLMGMMAAAAMADGPVGADPSSNFTVGPLPPDCQTDPTGTVCINAAVSYLDQARASLGQPAYVLPSDFDSLNPDQQALVLTDLDHFLDYEIGMLTTVIVGSTNTFVFEGYMVTPRGYTNKYTWDGAVLPGQRPGRSLVTHATPAEEDA